MGWMRRQREVWIQKVSGFHGRALSKTHRHQNSGQASQQQRWSSGKRSYPLFAGYYFFKINSVEEKTMRVWFVRQAIRNFMRTECKCHGLSGSCTVRTCWRKMPPFRDVGNRLKESFDGAAKVIPSNDGHSFITEGPTIKPPDRFDLIYSEDSPDFCKPNRKTGSLGTQGRRCNSTSQGVDGCELLCCGRGYDTRIVKEKINCECRFRWCCEVTCNTCLVKKTINTCR